MAIIYFRQNNMKQSSSGEAALNLSFDVKSTWTEWQTLKTSKNLVNFSDFLFKNNNSYYENKEKSNR